VVAAAGVALALWFFTANDGATTSGPPATAPGVAATAPPQYAGDVRRGNVVLQVRSGDVDAVRAFAAKVAGPEDPALRAAGQAVVVVGDPGLGIAEPEITCTDQAGATTPCGPRAHVVAWAQGRRLEASSPDDPALRAFVEYWLGRVAG
jgi:hypothetical protein